MPIIRNVAAWFNTDEAVDWMRVRLEESELMFRRVDPMGIEFTYTGRDGVSDLLGIRSEDLVKLGRYILAVAAAQGQNINEGFMGVSEK